MSSIHATKPEAVKKVYLRALEVPYPPEDKFVADNEEILSRWDAYLKVAIKSDPRTKSVDRQSVHLLDRSKLQHVASEGENIDCFDMDSVISKCML